MGARWDALRPLLSLLAPFAFAPLASPETASLDWLLALLAMALASVAVFAIAVKQR